MPTLLAGHGSRRPKFGERELQAGWRVSGSARFAFGDGAPSCSSDAELSNCPGPGCELLELLDANLVPTVASAAEVERITTHVIGVDIVDALIGADPQDSIAAANVYDVLNDVASAGGDPRPGDEKFHNTHNPTDLTAALELVLRDIACTVPIDLEVVTAIEVAGTTYEIIDDCSAGDGASFDDAELRLCGAACDGLLDTQVVTVSVPCP